MEGRIRGLSYFFLSLNFFLFQSEKIPGGRFSYKLADITSLIMKAI